MYHLFAQMSLLSQGRDIEGWMDIFILVIIAVVYLLGAIVKAARSKKEEDQSQRIQKPQQKPSKGGGGLFEQFVMEVKKAAEEASKGVQTGKPVQRIVQQPVRPPVAVQKYAGQVKQVSQSQVKAAPSPPVVKPKVSRTIPKVESEFEELAQLDKGIQGLTEITTKVAGLPSKKKVKPAETVEYMYLSDVLSDYYKDPEEFKRAILHYEILGKPLALRSPDEGIIGL